MLHPWSLGPGQVHLSLCSLAFQNIMFQQDSCPSFGIFWALRAWLSDQMMRWYTFLSMIKTLSSLKDCHHIMGNRVEWYLYLYLKNVTISWDSEWDASSAFRRNPMKRTIVLHSIYISCAQHNTTHVKVKMNRMRRIWRIWFDYMIMTGLFCDLVLLLPPLLFLLPLLFVYLYAYRPFHTPCS